VIRSLQRGGGATARDAARAREALLALERKAPAAEPREAERAPEPGVDWRRARPGDPVRVHGSGAGTLLALPDARGRVRVQVGAARLELPAERLSPAEAAPRPAGGFQVDPLPAEARPSRLDVRGQRVDEAIAALEQALDDAARAGVPVLEVVHGVGTGALMSALREHLRRLPHVARFEAGGTESGGAGVTRVFLR
jgi:DNA mismatch repair protein MutS2